MERTELAATVVERLAHHFPDARYELDWQEPWHLLVATILAAQATDVKVNAVTPVLFSRWPTLEALGDADQAELEEVLRPTGFFRRKAAAVKETARALVERFAGAVPRTVEELVTLPGVARKTANVVLTNAFDLPSGIIVDVHVARVSARLGLTDAAQPEAIEQDLMGLVPVESWTRFGPAMVLLGRYTCTARAPKCPGCVMTDVCPRRGVDGAPADAAGGE